MTHTDRKFVLPEGPSVPGSVPERNWTLDENQFIGPIPIPEDALNIIRNTVDEVDFWGLAQYYDNGD